MTTGLMRRFSSTACSRLAPRSTSLCLTTPRFLSLNKRTITDGRPRQASLSKTWFTSSSNCPYPESDEPPNERNLKLGTTIRTLHDRLPTLLASPLPQDILAPNITLCLFPSTHPHLPTVSGKLAYTAALTTAPVAWGRVPVIGNIKLHILSERMVKNGGCGTATQPGHEKLIVRWKTCEKGGDGQASAPGDAMEKITKILGVSTRPNEAGEFCGLFLFEFDDEGRIVRHVIEHAEEGGNWDKSTKVIDVTDWLLGRAWGRRDEGSPSLAFARVKRERSQPRRRNEERW